MSAKGRKPGLYRYAPVGREASGLRGRDRNVSESSTADSADDAMWEGFRPDAARAIRARQGFEEAVASTLDAPFDPSTHGRVVKAVEELSAAVPAALRVAQLRVGGAA
jgi:hypothetical protein